MHAAMYTCKVMHPCMGAKRACAHGGRSHTYLCIWVAVSYMHARRPRPLRMCIACGPRIDACIRRGRAHVRCTAIAASQKVRDRDAYMRIYIYIHIM